LKDFSGTLLSITPGFVPAQLLITVITTGTGAGVKSLDGNS
jgi:hypothetical protein